MKTDEKREAILQAAKRVFALYGFKKTSVEDIGREAGMTKSNLYFYFRNKQDIYDQVIRTSMERWYEEIREAFRGAGDCRQRLADTALISFNYLKRDTELSAIILQDESIIVFTHRDDRFHEVNSKSMQLLISIIEEGQREGTFRNVNARKTAGFIFSVFNMFLVRVYVKKIDTGYEDFTQAFDIIIRGLLA